MRRAFALGMVLAACVAMVALAGCQQQKKTELQPTVAPPAIMQAGVLKVGVNLDYPPFAGTDNGRQAGLDLDVAAALAEKLGLKLETVDVKASDAATALADRRADVVLSVPFSAESGSDVSLAGSYVSDGPGYFVAVDNTASAVPTMTPAKLPTTVASIGAQTGSVAYWLLTRSLVPGTVKGYGSLRDALADLDSKDLKVVAGDTVVGAYIARDFDRVRFAGQVTPANLLGAAVKPDNTALGDKVRSALDELAADGILDALRLKWVGDLPKLAVSGSQTTSETTGTSAP